MILRKNILLALLFLATVLSACDDFLGEAPSKREDIKITTVEQLDGFLVEVPEIYCDAYALSSDIYELSPEARKAGKATPHNNRVFYWLWDSEQIPSCWTRDDTWNSCYSCIFNMNTILTNVDRVSGSKELKKEVVAAAHYYRATRNWVLVNTYALPYCEENLEEMGIPRKETTSFEESAERMTIEESYEFIEKDLLAALEISKTGFDRNWRVSLPAVHAFLARFYFYMNNYAEALKYAELALKANSNLVDYNDPTKMYTSDKALVTKYNQKLFGPQVFWDTDILANDWPEFYHQDFQSYTITLHNLTSSAFVDMFDKDNDLRYKYCIVKNLGWYHGYPQDVCVDGWVMWGGGSLMYGSKSPYAPTVPEMLLTKAECQARTGNWQDAMNTVNILRAKRMVPGENANLTASSQQEAVEKIIDERTRELNFATRWFDMRRLNNNETSYDDFSVVRKYYPYNNSLVFDTNAELVESKLESKDRRYAIPIYADEIALSDGQLKQNTY